MTEGSSASQNQAPVAWRDIKDRFKFYSLILIASLIEVTFLARLFALIDVFELATRRAQELAPGLSKVFRAFDLAASILTGILVAKFILADFWRTFRRIRFSDDD